MKIDYIPLNDNQYVKEVTAKKSIVFHHTAGNKSAPNVVSDWNTDTRGRIATAFVIGYDGQIVQCFDEKFWAYALGIKQANNKEIEKQSIQIELCAWGYAKPYKNGFINAYGGNIDSKEVVKIDFKGYQYYHRYSDEQLNSLKELVEYLCEKHKIKGSLGMSDFDVSAKALNGVSGFWTHNSFRKDKSDIYPDTRILDMFKKGWNPKYST